MAISWRHIFNEICVSDNFVVFQNTFH